MNPPNHFRVPRPFCRLKAKSKLFGILGPHFATIAKFQWFWKEPSPLNVFSLIDHWHRWFFNDFPQILVRWSTMVLALSKDLKKLANATYPIFWQMHLMIEKGDKWIIQIISEFPGHFADWRQNKNLWTFRTTFGYHCKISMVFKGTITIEWNG